MGSYGRPPVTDLNDAVGAVEYLLDRIGELKDEAEMLKTYLVELLKESE